MVMGMILRALPSMNAWIGFPTTTDSPKILKLPALQAATASEAIHDWGLWVAANERLSRLAALLARAGLALRDGFQAAAL
jgi:hypothetical protein